MLQCTVGGAAAVILSGCGISTALASLAQPQKTKQPLQVAVVAEQPINSSLVQALRDIASNVDPAITVSSVGSVEWQSWFPASTPGQVVDFTHALPIALSDDPSIAMPDIVVSAFPGVTEVLAIRALDLSTEFKTGASRLAGIPSAVLERGKMLDPAQGFIQANAPILRSPVVVTHAPKASLPETVDTQGWSWDEFQSFLKSTGTGDTPAPVSLGLRAEPLTLGSLFAAGWGGVLARSSDQECIPAFTDKSTQAGLLALLGLRPQKPGPVYFSIISLADWLASYTHDHTFGTFAIAPVPGFSAGAKTQAIYTSATVWRHTKAPQSATNFVMSLYDTANQQRLAASGWGVPVRASQGAAVLPALVPGLVQNAHAICDATNDVSPNAVLGNATPKNLERRLIVESDLATILAAYDYALPTDPTDALALANSAASSGQLVTCEWSGNNLSACSASATGPWVLIGLGYPAGI